MFDFAAFEWTKLPSMPTGRHGHGCGVIQKADGTQEAVVAGGDDYLYFEKSVEIYNIETQSWR